MLHYLLQQMIKRSQLKALVSFFSKFICLDSMNFQDPLNLSVGKEYNLNILKEVKVTESFLGLDKDVTQCQNKESYNDCKTKKYVNALIEFCGCIPFSLNTIYEVSPKIF